MDNYGLTQYNQVMGMGYQSQLMNLATAPPSTQS